MPFVDPSPDSDWLLASPLGENIPPSPSAPTLGQTVSSAFLQENSLASLIARLQDKVMPPEPGHNPLDTIKGTRFEEEYLDSFAGSRSKAETHQIMSRIERDESQRQQLDSAGIGGRAVQLIAGMLDPVNFLPVGATVRAARTGVRFAEGVMKAGAAGVVSSAAQEGILQASQEIRPWQDSALSIGSATLLSAIIGGGAAALLSKPERAAMEQGLDQMRRDIDMDSGGGFGTSTGAAVADERELQLRNFTGPVGPAIQRAADAVERVPYVGKPAAAVLRAPEALNDRLSPTMTVFSSPFQSARRTMADLAETALEFADNERGVPTSYNIPISRHVEMVKNRMMIQFHDEMDQLWKDYYFAGQPAGPAARLRADINRLANRNPEGRLTFGQFKEAAAKAAREGDQHPIPQVAAAAQAFRRTVDAPLLLKAQELKLFPEDMAGPKGDTSHVLRAFNKEAIRQNPNGFVDKVASWYEADQSTKAQAKARLADMWKAYKEAARKGRKLGGRIDTQDRHLTDLESRLAERDIETKRGDQRFSTLEERKQAVTDEIAELETFLGDLKDTARSPELAERVKGLEGELRILKAAEQKAQPTEADLARIEADEVKSILTGPMRRVSNYLTGKTKNLPRQPSFLAYLAKKGGIRDTDGDIARILDGKGPRGVVRSDGEQVDLMIKSLRDEFPEHFGGPEAYGKDSPDTELLYDAIRSAANGEEPWWFVEARMPAKDREVLETVRGLEKPLERAGVDVRSPADVAALFRGEDPATLADLDRAVADMEAASADIPPSVLREAGGTRLAAEREGIKQLRQQIDRTKTKIERRQASGGKIEARSDEVEIAARANRGRVGILSDRAERAALKREILEAAAKLSEEDANSIRANIEDELVKWQGKSAIKAQQAIKARNEGDRIRGLKKEAGIYEGEGKRLISADGDVDATVRQILASDRDLSSEELRARAVETMNRITAVPDGRLPYDIESPSGPMRDDGTGPRRGSMIGRQFAIPSSEIEDFLVNDIEELARRQVNTLVPDLMMIERFGNVEMEPQFRAIQEEVAQKALAASTPEEARAIKVQGERVETAMRGVMGRVRGTFGYSPSTAMRNLGRMSAVARNANYMIDLGGAAISQVTDMAGAIFRVGLGHTLQHAWVPLLRNLATGRNDPAWKAIKKQAHAMGIGLETAMHSRDKALGDIAYEVSELSRFERTVAAGASGFSKLNLMGPMTDIMKVAASSAVSNDILKSVRAVSDGTATKKQVRTLAAAGIDPAMAKEIWENASAPGGLNDFDGTLVPNTSSWSNQDAASRFEAAVNRDVDIAVVTPGQEKPLWMSHPVAALLGQFKTFMAAAHERILLANLQRRDAQALSGVLTSMALGTLSAYLYAVASNRELPKRPQDWIKEGFDRSGLLGWISEANGLSSKVTRGTIDVYRLIGADKPLSRYASRSALGALLGPTAGKLESLQQIMGSAATGEWTAADTRRLRRLVAGQNLFYLRRLFDQVEQDGNALFRVPETAQ